MVFFPTGQTICPSKDFPPRGEKICPRNLGVWLYTCCGDEFNECCGTISNFGWLIIGIIGAAAVATLAAVIVNNRMFERRRRQKKKKSVCQAEKDRAL
ncbi:hypothetical protein RB195_006242 [Necator americanus]|uniref:Uncharacterized protein n=1 Tax=Necator americanus TaxID=51031 RepID=A0ABR1BRM2_NECAM